MNLPTTLKEYYVQELGFEYEEDIENRIEELYVDIVVYLRLVEKVPLDKDMMK